MLCTDTLSFRNESQPRSVTFFTSTGQQLGTKASLEQEISAATQIPVTALRATSLANFTVTERFSWQEGGETKAPEDRAYSLFGLFGVSVLIIYGEGYVVVRRRLEKEILEGLKGKASVLD